MRAASLALCAIVLVSAACGSEGATDDDAAPVERPAANVADSSDELPRLARALVLPEALDDVAPDELSVEECGISPVVPCVRLLFSLAEGDVQARLARLRAQAEHEGWTIVNVERHEHGASLELRRGPFHARYSVGEGLEGVVDPSDIADLVVFGPPQPLPAPSAAARAGWSHEKREFVAAANAICARARARLAGERTGDPEKDVMQYAEVLAGALDELEALAPPLEDQRDVSRLLGEVRRLQQVVDAFAATEGEEVLAVGVGAMEQLKTVNEAASRYGLVACVDLG